MESGPRTFLEETSSELDVEEYAEDKTCGFCT